VAATRYKSDDFHPYLFATHDWGATWTRIDKGIDGEHFTRVIRADPEKKGLLFAGTERGVYASFDDGASWQRFNLNLPIVPITDLAIRDGILIAATQGRAFWALDDLALLRQGVGEPTKSGADPAAPHHHLYVPAPVLRLPGGGRRGDDATPNLGVGSDPAVGAVVYYRLDKAPEKPIEVAFLGADGKVLRKFAGEAMKKDEKDSKDGKVGKDKDSKDEKADKDKKDAKAKKDKKEPKTPQESGLNRFVWDLRLGQAADFPGMILWNGNPPGPRVAPGRYQVRLTVDGAVETADFEVRPDPRSSTSVADLQAQYDFLLSIRDKLSETHRAIGFIRETRGSIDALASRLEGDDKKAVRDAAEALKKQLSGVEEALYQTKMESRQDPLNFPIRLNDKLAGVAGAAGTGDFPPTASGVAVYHELVTAIDAQLAKLRQIVAERLPAFEAQAREAGITLLPAQIPTPPAEEAVP
jgi:hypothetical protein